MCGLAGILEKSLYAVRTAEKHPSVPELDPRKPCIVRDFLPAQEALGNAVRLLLALRLFRQLAI
jgi:hypothetical protein